MMPDSKMTILGCQHYCAHGAKCKGPYQHSGNMHRSTGAGVNCEWTSEQSLSRFQADRLLVERYGLQGFRLVMETAAAELAIVVSEVARRRRRAGDA